MADFSDFSKPENKKLIPIEIEISCPFCKADTLVYIESKENRLLIVCTENTEHVDRMSLNFE